MMDLLRLGLIGHNIHYSASPAIYDEIFFQARRPGTFVLFDIAADQLGQTLSQAENEHYRGLAVTVPYKLTVRDFCASVTSTASAIGAVNALRFDPGDGWIGHNTDVEGFSRPLRSWGDRTSITHALVLGTGGAARAVIVALAELPWVKALTISGRDPVKTAMLLDWARELQSFDRVVSTTHPRMGIESFVGAQLVINATTVGGPNYLNETLWRENVDWSDVQLFYDLNYNEDNKLLAAASSLGVQCQSGAAMLVAQAVAMYAWWTGEELDPGPVFARVFPDIHVLW